MERTKIRVLIAEDMEPIRKRYIKILSQTEEIQVVADVASGEDAVQMTRISRPDVILMDIEMETKDAGLKAAKKLLFEFPELKIIILTVYEEDTLIYQAFQFGVRDYLLKNAKPPEIIDSIRTVYLGTAPLRPELANKILGEFKRVKTYEDSFLHAVDIVSSLTSTEIEILKLLLEHKTRKEICRIRCVELSTVKSQIRAILQKFHASSTEEVVATIQSLHLYDFITNQVDRIRQG